MISPEALRATGLLQPGAQVRWHYRLRLADNDASDAAVQRTIAAASAQVPDAGWEVRSRSNASPGLERNIERFTQYLTLVGLTALLVGGVGVANAIRGHLDRKRDTIATMKSLGATGGSVFAIYLTQAMALAFIGADPGPHPRRRAAVPDRLGVRHRSCRCRWRRRCIPRTSRSRCSTACSPRSPSRSGRSGARTTCSVSALFRDEVAPERRWPRTIYVALTVVAVATLAVLAVKLAYDQRIAAIFVRGGRRRVRLAAAGGEPGDGGGEARAAAALDRAAARDRQHPPPRRAHAERRDVARPRPRAARHRDRGRRQSAPPVHRGAAGAGAVVLLPRHPVRRRRALRRLHPPARARRDARTRADAARAHRVGERRARRGHPGARRARTGCCKAIAASPIRTPSRPARASPRAHGGRPDYSGPPLVSFEQPRRRARSASRSATPIVVNVLGRNIEARVANLRTLDWQSLGINFAMVFAPASLRGAPHTFIATLTYPGGSTVAQETALLKAAADTFPAITTVRVREAIDSVGGLDHQPGGGAARRQRAHAADRRAGARRRAGGRTPPPRLRRGRAQDRGRHPRQAARRLCPRIPDARRRHRRVRRRRRHRRRRAS